MILQLYPPLSQDQVQLLFMLLIIFGIGFSALIEIPKEANPDIDIPVAYVSVGLFRNLS